MVYRQKWTIKYENSHKVGFSYPNAFFAVATLRADFTGSYSIGDTPILDNWTLTGTASWATPDNGVTGNLGMGSGTGSSYIYYTRQAAQQETVYLTPTYDSNKGVSIRYATWSTVVPPTSPSWTLLDPNASGQSAQFMVNKGNYFGFQITHGQNGNRLVSITGFNVNPVPEPTTYALLSGLALIGFVAYRRFRRMPATV